MRRPRSPFDILGVSPADDITTIRLAWRAKVRRLHPDRATDTARASAELAEVNAAFDALQGHEPRRDGLPAAAGRVCRGRKGPAARPGADTVGRTGNSRHGDAHPGAVSLRVVVQASVATDARGRAIRGYLAARPFIAAA